MEITLDCISNLKSYFHTLIWFICLKSLFAMHFERNNAVLVPFSVQPDRVSRLTNSPSHVLHWQHLLLQEQRKPTMTQNTHECDRNSRARKSYSKLLMKINTKAMSNVTNKSLAGRKNRVSSRDHLETSFWRSSKWALRSWKRTCISAQAQASNSIRVKTITKCVGNIQETSRIVIKTLCHRKCNNFTGATANKLCRGT